MASFKVERSKFRQSLKGARKEFVSESVLECNRDNKKLYKLASSLMGMKKENQLPEYDSKEELANQFAEFFIAKIQTIRDKLDDLPLYDLQDSSPPKLSSLEPLTNEEVKHIVKEMPAKYCDLDAVPTSIIKEALDLLLPTLVKLVNLSLVEGEFVQQWKTALVKPLLKKVGMELTNTSYRPVSNLPFLSKVVEKSVLLRFNRHYDENNLMPSYQSAYRANFSCETALVKLTDDLLWAMEYQEVTPLVAIDLSAAFDTVDHDMLLSVLSKKFGVVDNALKWFDAYLRPRRFQVLIGNTRSKEIDLPFSVPQGSCAGPVLYSAYASTLQEVVNDNDEPPKKNKPIELHGFVDDHAYKGSFAARSRVEEINMIKDLESCAERIKIWMDGNRLKMNNSKTEFIMYGSNKMLTKCRTADMNINGTWVKKQKVIRYLGVWMDEVLSFKYHVKMKCRSAMFNLVRIKRLRPSLTVEAANILVMGLVISHLDYANSILIRVLDVTIKQLQHVQNMAAKVVLQADKYASPKECMKNLHWLPVHKRVEHKLLPIVYKCIRGTAPEYL